MPTGAARFQWLTGSWSERQDSSDAPHPIFRTQGGGAAGSSLALDRLMLVACFSREAALDRCPSSPDAVTLEDGKAPSRWGP